MSGTASITVGVQPYCAATHTSVLTYFYISNVKLGSIDNTTNQGNTSTGYSDQTSVSTSMNAGATETLSVSFTPNWAANKGAAWIDWNGDGDFDDANEEVMNTSGGTSPYTANVTVPVGAKTGATRMRVRLSWNSTLAACGSIAYGETEDYTINVGGGTDPVLTSITVSPSSSSIAQNGNQQFTTQGKDQNGNNMNATVSWSATGGSINSSGLFTGSSTGTFTITATSGSVSGTALVTVTGGAEYCAAGATNGPEHISNVSFGTINNSSTRSNYQDHTGVSTTVSKGGSYALIVTIGSVYNGDKATSWFDWNGDGDFEDAGEKFALTVSGSTATASITVPTSATATSTRMRIRVHYYAAQADMPCTTPSSSYGEVEDYTINISSAAAGASYSGENFNVAKSNLAVFPNPSEGQFMIKLSSDYVGKVDIKILDMSGKIINQKQVDKFNKNLDVQMSTNNKPGTYLLQLVSGSEMINSTLIIK